MDIANKSVSTTLPLPISPQPSNKSQDTVDDESGDDDATDSEYHSFSDSDTEESEVEQQTEEERQIERETRALERQMVLEAAGLVVKQDTTRRPPPRPMRRKSTVGGKKKYRPPPAVPLHQRHMSNASDKDKALPLPPSTPETEADPREDVSRLDDAYERYEAFKLSAAASNRFSQASLESSPVPSSPSGSLFAPPMTPSKSMERDVSDSRSYSSMLHNFLGRSRTPVQESGTRVMPTISAPILNVEGAPARENSPAFGSSWASLVDKSALEGLPERERKRQEAIFELIATEAAYVRDLQLIVEIFYASMLNLLEPKAITVVFANVEDLLLTNTTFLSSLEERQRSCRLYIDQIGDVLDRHMQNMTSYREYCANHGNAIKVLQSLRQSKPELATHLQRLRDDPAVRNLDLSSYLLVPMQRITRYPLLIKQILHYTEPDQDRALTERALRTAEKILHNINESIRDQESRQRLSTLSQNLWIGTGRLDLTAPTRHMGDRKLLKEGLLSKAKSGRKLRAFLCSDILVLTDEQAKTLYRMPIPLSEIQVGEAPGSRDDLAFQLSLAFPRGGDKIALRASSARDCHLWMADIDLTSRKCRDAERKAAKASRPA